MKRCTVCLLPETKPDLYFNDQGECAACVNYRNRASIDWNERRRDLITLLDRYRGERVIVPVSGGKDSTFQCVTMLEHGMKVLAVTAATDYLTPLGLRNLQNLKRLGVDHVWVSPNPRVRAKIMRIGLTVCGDYSWGEHALIFAAPVRVAIQHGVRLIVWGESSQSEYGQGREIPMGRRWVSEFAGLNGLRPSDMVGRDGITADDMHWYTYPSEDDIERVGVQAIWLGSYLPWSGRHNAEVAIAHGFTPYDPQATLDEGSYWPAENLDNVTGWRDAAKFGKFCFGRVTDQASCDIRRGLITRAEGAELVRQYDGRWPKAFRGVSLDELAAFMGMTAEEIVTDTDKWCNPSLFHFKDGKPVKDEHGRPVPKDWGF